MNKDQLIEKLAGNSFEEYLTACNHLSDYVKSRNELNQEIIERALAVNLFPLWANHKDLDSKLVEITDELPKHSDLLNHTELKHDFMGLSLFVNGLINGEFDVSGFLWCSNGYICSSQACESISEHYKETEKDKDAAYFNDLSKWFSNIYSATTAVFGAILEIDSWNKNMVVGLKNMLNQSFEHYGVFEWILSGLYKVVDDPLIQKNVFDHYIDLFTTTKEGFEKEENTEVAKDLTEKIKNLRKLAKGENV